MTQKNKDRHTNLTQNTNTKFCGYVQKAMANRFVCALVYRLNSTCTELACFLLQVWYTMVENSEPVFLLNFDNVPKEKLNLVKPKLDNILSSILASPVPIDMNRLSTVIHRHRLEALSHLENSPHESIAYVIIGHMLYGNNPHDVSSGFSSIKPLSIVYYRTRVYISSIYFESQENMLCSTY